MTTPRDDIAGLSERLRDGYAHKRPFPLNRIDQGPVVAPAYAIHDHDLRELLSELDALLKERDALQARVKELEDGRNFWKSERDRIKAFLSEGDWQTVKSEQAWRNRALRAEQERDEAYEQAAKEAESHCYGSTGRAIGKRIRSLAAGPEKEGK